MRLGASDASLPQLSGKVTVTELVDRLAVSERSDAAIGSIEAHRRGFTGEQVLAGLAARSFAGEEFLVGLDRHRADTAGQLLA